MFPVSFLAGIDQVGPSLGERSWVGLMPLSGVSMTQHYPSDIIGVISFPLLFPLLARSGRRGRLLKHLQTVEMWSSHLSPVPLHPHSIVHPQTSTVWLEKHDLPYSSSNPEEGTVSPAKEEI